MPKVSKLYHFCIDGTIVFSGSLTACQQIFDVVNLYWKSTSEYIINSYADDGVLSALDFEDVRAFRRSLPVYSIVLATSAGADDILCDQMCI